MITNKDSQCPCGSKKKFKYCCIELHQERLKWNSLEKSLRKKVQEFWEKFYRDKYTNDAISCFDKDIDWNDISDRRLFFDWLLHDYLIKENGKSITTIIQKFVKDCHDHLDSEEKKTSKLWADSALRFYEVLDIKKGVGYTIMDVFDNQGKPLFLFDQSSSFTISKYDILYARLYYVGDIIRSGGGSLIVLPRRFLPVIKEYVWSSFQIFTSKRNKECEFNFEHETPDLNDYFRKESLSIIKYTDSLKLQPVITTAQGDLLVLSKSSFLIKNKNRLLSILDNSKYFVELEDEGNVLRYDWVKELEEGKIDFFNDNNNKYDNNKGNDKDKDKHKSYLSNLSEKIALNTILWVSEDEYEDDLQESKNFFNINDSDDGLSGSGIGKKEGRYIPYLVLGNISIDGKNLDVECLSDSLLYQCNDLIQLLAGKYLKHLGNVYKEISSSPSDLNADQMVDSMNDYEHYHNNSDDDDSDDFNAGESEPKEIKRFFNQMLENYYETWIIAKIPSLGNKTPLQYAKTKKGKEVVRELLKVMENDFARNSKSDLPPFPFEKVKEKLGL